MVFCAYFPASSSALIHFNVAFCAAGLGRGSFAGGISPACSFHATFFHTLRFARTLSTEVNCCKSRLAVFTFPLWQPTQFVERNGLTVWVNAASGLIFVDLDGDFTSAKSIWP